MIDEKKLIKDLEETVRVSVKAGDCTARKLLGLFMVVITNQPKAGEWTPCSEGPPENGTYLCTLDGELCGIDEPFTGMCGIENGKWDEEGCVLAWQPLPEPWKAPGTNVGCKKGENQNDRRKKVDKLFEKY